MIVYGFYFNPCVGESASMTMSIHFSKENAESAMKNHKKQEEEIFNAAYEDNEEAKAMFKFDDYKRWYICEIEILP
jgi:hypothetical protein